MPTTALKNHLYRLALPFLSPCLPRCPELSILGDGPVRPGPYVRFLRKHHVMGSAAIFSSGGKRTAVFCPSPISGHVSDENTLFRIASITKTATALTTLALCEAGLLALDRPVAEYMPDEDRIEEIRGVTLRMLLSHTSGISDMPDYENYLNRGVPWTKALRGRRCAEPGTAFRYSNLGFGLIGCIWEYVTGLSLREVFRKYLFDPLGLDAYIDATEADESRIMPVTRIMPYHAGSDLTVTKLGRIPLDMPDPLHHYGHTAGSLYITVSSLETLIRCVMDGGIPVLRSPDREMTKQHAEYGKISPTLSYGLGILIIRDSMLSSSRILGHQGFAYGCADGAFWEESTGNLMIFLNGGCSEARKGRLGLANYDLLRYALKKEFPRWN